MRACRASTLKNPPSTDLEKFKLELPRVRAQGCRVAICIAGEQRSATCAPRGSQFGAVSPLESQADFLAVLPFPQDVFVVLDTPPKADDVSLIGVGHNGPQNLLDSTIRATQAFARMHPTAVEFDDTRKAEAAYWTHIRLAVCVKPAAAMQARKLQACWRLITQREAQLNISYSHIVRLRPDLLVTSLTAKVVAAHIAAACRPPPSTAMSSQVQCRSANLSCHSCAKRASTPWSLKCKACCKCPHCVPGTTAAAVVVHRPKHGWGDRVCLHTHSNGHSCQVSCGNGSSSVTTLDGGSALEVADVLTVPPFTQALRNDTFVNDVFWVASRSYAAALFDHLSYLSSWGHREQQRRRERARTLHPVSGRQQGVSSTAADMLCGAAPRLEASPACADALGHISAIAPTCATGGHECMVSQALAAQTRRAGLVRGSSDPNASLQVEYLTPAGAAPQVMRLSDADQRVCASLQQAYLCSEKKKVRRPDSSMNGSTSASPLAGVAGAVAGAANAEQARRCKVQDRLRKSVQPRTKVLATS